MFDLHLKMVTDTWTDNDIYNWYCDEHYIWGINCKGNIERGLVPVIIFFQVLQKMVGYSKQQLGIIPQQIQNGKYFKIDSKICSPSQKLCWLPQLPVFHFSSLHLLVSIPVTILSTLFLVANSFIRPQQPILKRQMLIFSKCSFCINSTHTLQKSRGNSL